MAASAEIDFSSLMRAVNDLGKKMADASRTMPILAEALVSSVQDVFEQEGAVGGNPRWPDLKSKRPRDASRKVKKRGKGARKRGRRGPKILQDTGIMAGSITPASNDTIVQAYTGVGYAVYHVSKAPRKVIPLRDFFAIDEAEFYKEAADVILAKFR